MVLTRRGGLFRVSFKTFSLFILDYFVEIPPIEALFQL